MAKYTPDNWPIACPMLLFGGFDSKGNPIQDADPEEWHKQMREVSMMGFTEMDPLDVWVRVADLSPERLDVFKQVLADNNLTVPAISTSRKSVMDPQRGDEYLAYSHRVIDTAVELGSEVISFGFFQPLTPAQNAAVWFWLEQGWKDPDDAELYKKAVSRIRELAEHAESVGVEISLEMYEDTYIGTSEKAVQFVKDVDHPAVGLNPDLANLVRLHRPLEPITEAFERMLPYTNHWHVKNYTRDYDPATGAYATHPSPLGGGYINFRPIIARALELGFDGPFMVEHYGSDSLWNLAESREYLRSVLRTKMV
ncbi:MAG: sugar phosphate isomerase/epimerase family protein [Brooklawnia sp.]|uniref:sugar phosphate isomerase/epimerase family protein n=1 Tax=Brooklawnia sp. TaxID=2699740 RepID=UPI003C72D325